MGSGQHENHIGDKEMTTITKRERAWLESTYPKCSCGNTLGLYQIEAGKKQCSRCERLQAEQDDIFGIVKTGVVACLETWLQEIAEIERPTQYERFLQESINDKLQIIKEAD
jgi:hypothetical protein